jgi:hypothetical protein
MAEGFFPFIIWTSQSRRGFSRGKSCHGVNLGTVRASPAQQVVYKLILCRFQKRSAPRPRVLRRRSSSFMEGEWKVEAGAFNAEARRGGGRRGALEEV